MKKALQTHKAIVKAKQEMRERAKPPATRQESPLFEPDHNAPPVTSEPQHNDENEVRVEEPVPLIDPSRDPRRVSRVGQAPLIDAASRKRKGMLTDCRSFGFDLILATAEEISDTDQGNVDDGDDDDDEDDGEDIVDGHDPDSEPLPDLPMYHPSVKVVESKCTELISRFQNYIKDNTYQDDETRYLLEESKKLEHAPTETHILNIAVVGDAGQGKSSLLNSMLGHANLANSVSIVSKSAYYDRLTDPRMQVARAALTSSSNMPKQKHISRPLSKRLYIFTLVKPVTT
jgi:hypothetical protein